ncbi:hypothetical protein B0H14DRAFT_3671017 [Mycena olivaceomarginata]|nr:hypothetical protein B0H14DRAFT_3671017 [Mycena olivaceomarginata]
MSGVIALRDNKNGDFVKQCAQRKLILCGRNVYSALSPTYALQLVRRLVRQHGQDVSRILTEDKVFDPCERGRTEALRASGGAATGRGARRAGRGREGKHFCRSRSLSGRSKDVPDSFVIGHRFGATNTLRLRRPNTATDTQSISRNIKYTQTPAETEDIGSPKTVSGIGHTSYLFSPTYSLRIRRSMWTLELRPEVTGAEQRIQPSQTRETKQIPVWWIFVQSQFILEDELDMICGSVYFSHHGCGE